VGRAFWNVAAGMVDSQVRSPRSRAGFLVLLCTAAALLASGCNGSRVTTHSRRFLRGQVSAKSQWSASGTLQNVYSAIDGETSTAARARSRGNDTITIDLGKVCYFNLVVIDHGPHEDACARRLAVLTSLDGRDFSYQCSAPGKRQVTNVMLDRPVLARYLRIQVVVPGLEPWSVAEVSLQ